MHLDAAEMVRRNLPVLSTPSPEGNTALGCTFRLGDFSHKGKGGCVPKYPSGVDAAGETHFSLAAHGVIERISLAGRREEIRKTADKSIKGY